MQHFLAAVFKTTVFKHAQTAVLILGDRCGAQELFECNQLSALFSNGRGAAIALGISIRFSMDILLGRITVPPSKNPNSLLFKHEKFLISELSEVLLKNTSRHQIEALILPDCQSLLEAIGHRFAYDSALANGVDTDVVDLFVASVVALDPARYVEVSGISRIMQNLTLIDAAQRLYPRLTELLDGLEVEPYVTAPIVSDEAWNMYAKSLKVYGNLQSYAPAVIDVVVELGRARL